MISNNKQTIDKLITEHHGKQNDPSSEVITINATHYPPGYPDNKQKEQCNKNEEKHKNCHPMHCHYMQPMQSATNASSIDKVPDHAQENSKK